MGTIRLALRNGEDNEQAKTSSTGFRDMIGSSGGGDRAKENPLAEGEKRFLEWADAVRTALKKAKAAPAKAAPQEDFERFKMRVLVGPGVKTRAEVNDVLLINNAGVQGLPGEGGAWTAMNLGSGANSSPMPEPHSPEPEPAASPKPAAAQPAAAQPAPSTAPGGSPRSSGG